MASAALLSLLAYGHILSAMGWLGGGILTAFVLGPNLRKLPPAASLEFNAKVLSPIVSFVQIMVVTTFVFGLLLLDAFYDGNFSPLMKSSQGMELMAGVALALAAAAVAFSFTFPSFKRVVKIARGMLQAGPQPPPPELMKYAKRARVGSMVGLLLLLVVLATMVSAGFGFY
jgi:uncharacterized membrane protein